MDKAVDAILSKEREAKLKGISTSDAKFPNGRTVRTKADAGVVQKNDEDVEKQNKIVIEEKKLPRKSHQ